MKKRMISTLVVLCLAIGLIVPVSAEEGITLPQNTQGINNGVDTSIDGESVAAVEINGEEVGVPIYISGNEAELETDSAETRSVVQVGTVYWKITRLQTNGTRCALDMRYVAISPRYAATRMKYSTMKVGTGLDFDKFGSFQGRIHRFETAISNGFLKDVRQLNIPVRYDRVAVRTTGLQVYTLIDGIWSIPGLNGEWVDVINP